MDLGVQEVPAAQRTGQSLELCQALPRLKEVTGTCLAIPPGERLFSAALSV